MLESIKFAIGYAKNTVSPPTIETQAYSLCDRQKEDLIFRGYIQIPNAVPKALCDRLLRHINCEFGKGLDPSLMTKYNSQVALLSFQNYYTFH